MKFFLMLLTLLGANLAALANAGSFGGFGSNLRLVENKDIQMLSERIVITLVPSKQPVDGSLKYSDEAMYDCTFKLKNLTDKEYLAKVCFHIGNGDYTTHRATPPGLYEFSAKCGGKEYEGKYLKSDADNKFSSLFVWDMEFEPSATLNLEVRYKKYGSIGLGITQNPPYNFSKILCEGLDLSFMQGSLRQSYAYIVTTGGSWAREIESAEFIVNLGDFERYLNKRGYLDYNEKSPHANKYKDNPLFEGALSRVVSPEGWINEGDSIVLKRTPYDASKDININYDFTPIPTTPEGLERLFKCATDCNKNKELSAKDKKNICDIVLEFYGIDTQNKSIEEFLLLQNWHNNKDRTYPTLSPKLKERLEFFSGQKQEESPKL